MDQQFCSYLGHVPYRPCAFSRLQARQARYSLYTAVRDETYSSKNTTRTHVSHTTSQKQTNTPTKRSGSSTCRTFLSLRQRGPSSSRRTRPPEPAPTLGKRRAQDLDGAASSVSPATRFNHPRVRCGDFTKIYSPSSACAPLRRAAPAAVSTPAPCRRCVSVNPDCFFSISYSCFVFISLRICHKRSTWIINCTFDQ